MLDCAIKHYKIVCQNTHSVNQRTNALHGIVCSYHFKGDLAAAKEYALLEEDETKRNQLLTLCLQGEEKRRHCQQLAHTHLYEFLHYLESGCPTRTVYCAVEQLVALLFPDGNLQDFHGLLANVLQKHSYIACKEEDYDETVALLQKAKYHTEQFIRYSAQDFYRYSSPFFDLIGDTKIASDTPDAPLENFRNFLESNTVYDPIRHRAEFQALTQK